MKEKEEKNTRTSENRKNENQKRKRSLMEKVTVVQNTEKRETSVRKHQRENT
jgi:hypothetical protein